MHNDEHNEDVEISELHRSRVLTKDGRKGWTGHVDERSLVVDVGLDEGGIETFYIDDVMLETYSDAA